MKLERKIKVIGSIDHDAYSAFSCEMDALEKSSKAPIEVELCTDGGESAASLAFASRIRLSPCFIKITAIGSVASAGVLILAYGDRRFMAKECWLMVHEEAGKVRGAVHDMQTEINQLQRLEAQCNGMLADVTSTSSQQWARYHEATTYFSAEECLELGIVDEVI